MAMDDEFEDLVETWLNVENLGEILGYFVVRYR